MPIWTGGNQLGNTNHEAALRNEYMAAPEQTQPIVAAIHVVCLKLEELGRKIEAIEAKLETK